jgi:hypothetical protein
MSIADGNIKTKVLQARLHELFDILSVRIATNDFYYSNDNVELNLQCAESTDSLSVSEVMSQLRIGLRNLSMGYIEGEIDDPRDCPKILSFAMNTISNDITSKISKKQEISLPYLKQPISYSNLSDYEGDLLSYVRPPLFSFLSEDDLLSLVGMKPIKLTKYWSMFVHNLKTYASSNLWNHQFLYDKARDSSIVRINKETLEMHRNYKDTLTSIARHFGWPNVIKYWEQLFRDRWIHNIYAYSYWWIILNLCSEYGIRSYKSTFNDLSIELIDPQMKSQPQKIIEKILEIRSECIHELTELRNNCSGVGDWLRGLFELLPGYYKVCMLCDLVSSILSEEKKDDIKKIYRFSAEMRADIVTTMISPDRYVPLVLSRCSETSDLDEAKKYLQFYCMGRIFIPRVIYEKFLGVIETNWGKYKRINYFLKFQEIIRNSLDGGYPKVYDFIYHGCHEEYTRIFSFDEFISSNEKYQKFGPIGIFVTTWLGLYFMKEHFFLSQQIVSYQTPKHRFLIALDRLTVIGIMVEPLIEHNKDPVNQGKSESFLTGDKNKAGEDSEWIRIFKEIKDALRLLLDHGFPADTVRNIAIILPRSYWTISFDFEGDKLFSIAVLPKWLRSKVKDLNRREKMIARRKSKNCLKLIRKLGLIDNDIRSVEIYFPKNRN